MVGMDQFDGVPGCGEDGCGRYLGRSAGAVGSQREFQGGGTVAEVDQPGADAITGWAARSAARGGCLRPILALGRTPTISRVRSARAGLIPCCVPFGDQRSPCDASTPPKRRRRVATMSDRKLPKIFH